MKDFRSLQVWDKAHQLTLSSYRVTNKFPKSELYAMTSQIRRCAVSIAANIAEISGDKQKSLSEYRALQGELKNQGSTLKDSVDQAIARLSSH